MSLPSGSAWSYTHRGYAFKRAWQQLKQSRLGTFLTLLMLGITLALPAIFLFLLIDADRVPLGADNGKSLTVYLNPAVPDLDGAELAADIALRASVAATDYISREEALTTFQEHAEVNNAIDVLESNPLPGAIIVYPHPDAQSQEALAILASELEKLPRVDVVQMDLVWVERLAAVLELGKKLISFLGLLLVATALIVIGNTVRLEMLRQRREMEVTELLGARRGFVIRPFLYLGALYGALGSLIAVIIAVLLHSLLTPSIQRLASAYGSSFELTSPGISTIAPYVAGFTILGLIIAFTTSLWRHHQISHHQGFMS